MTRTPFPPAGARLAPQAQHITGGLSFSRTIGRPADFFKKYGPEGTPSGLSYGPEGTPSGLSLSKNLCREETAQVGAGELEGAATRLEWDRMP